MKYNELTLSRFTRSSRPGRGISAGQGKTAGRGTKGQKARTGKKLKPGFEGGQTKLSMRLPKARGFKHAPKIAYQVINLSDLNKVSGKTVDVAALAKAGVIGSPKLFVKLLGGGTVESVGTVKIHAASASAIKAVEKAGGSIELIVKAPTKLQLAVEARRAAKADASGSSQSPAPAQKDA